MINICTVTSMHVVYVAKKLIHLHEVISLNLSLCKSVYNPMMA